MEYKNVQILGADYRHTTHQAPDGIAEILNFEPVTSGKSVYWKLIPKNNALPFDLGLIDTEAPTHYVWRAGWFNNTAPLIYEEVRDQDNWYANHPDVNNFWTISSAETLGNLNAGDSVTTVEAGVQVLVATDVVNLTNQADSSENGYYTIGAIPAPIYTGGTKPRVISLLEMPGANWERKKGLITWCDDGDFEDSRANTVDFQNLKRLDTVLINHNTTKELYFLSEDEQAIPALFPRIERPSVSETLVTFTANQIAAGETYGFDVQETGKKAGVIFTITLKTGEVICHTAPYFVTLGLGSGSGTHRYVTASAPPIVTMAGSWFEDKLSNVGNYDRVLSTERASVLSFWEDQIESTDMWITKDHVSGVDTVLDGLYYKVRSWNVDDIAVGAADEFQVNADELLTRELLPVDAFSWHRLSANAQYAWKERLVLGGIITDFGYPSIRSIQDLYSTGHDTDAYIQVTLKEDGQTFTRTEKVTIECVNASLNSYSVRNMYVYPDQRAVSIQIWAKDNASGDYDDVETVLLSAHPELNLAYHWENGRGAKTIGTTGLIAESAIPVDNDDNLYEPNKVKASGQLQYYFPLVQTYSVGQTKDDIIAFASNTEAVSEGQFGQFPLYIFKRNSIHAFDNRGAADVLFNSIVEISERIGLPHKDALAVSEDVLYFQGASVSNERFVSLFKLRGATITAMDEKVREAPQFFADLFTAALPKVVMGYDFNRKELLVSIHHGEITVPSGLLAYNKLHDIWYYRDPGFKPVHFFSALAESGSGTDYDYSDFLGLEYYTSSQEGTERIWNLNDFDLANETAAEITTWGIDLGSPRAYKKLGENFVRGLLKTKAAKTYTVKLYGIKKDYSDQLLVTYTVNGTDYLEVEDLLFKHKYGSFQAYRVEIEGDFLPDTQIEGIEFTYENRYRHKIRR